MEKIFETIKKVVTGKAFKVTIKTLMITLASILAVLIVFIGGTYILTSIDKEAVEYSGTGYNPGIAIDGRADVSAHRSGADIYPENTLEAFINCVNSNTFNTDIFEFDLHITADGVLILLHDSTLDRTTDAVEYFGEKNVLPSEKTYAELRQLNFGENFKNLNGEYPYRGLRGDEIPGTLRVVSLDAVLSFLEEKGNYQYIIEIKDSGELGCQAAQTLYETLIKYDILDKVFVGTFNGDVTKYIDENLNGMLRSASIKEVIVFYTACALNLDLEEDFFDYVALQIPHDGFVVFNLDSQRIIDYAHRYNIAVQYWTVNDPDKIKMLNDMGADAIISDNPEMAYELING